MKYALIILACLVTSCNIDSDPGLITDEDLASIQALHDNYRLFWLENDSTKVVNLFHTDGALIPPGNAGDFVQGRAAMGAWWFTVSDNTTYPIRVFEYSNDSLIVVDSNTAIREGVSTFEWDTVIGDSVASSSQSSSNFLTVYTRKDGEWRILRHIWNARPAG